MDQGFADEQTPAQNWKRYFVHFSLFVLTFLTTTFAGVDWR